MQLASTFDLSSLTPAELAQFEAKCQKQRTTPDKKLSALIRAEIKPAASTAKKGALRP